VAGRNAVRNYPFLSHVRGNYPEAPPHYQSRAVKLEAESRGFCPLCGYWVISTDVVINEVTGERGDKCLICETLFAPSALEFIDSKICKGGHPKDYHEKNAMSCVKGRERDNCECKKYEPTKVTIKKAAEQEDTK
jgi:hypothetical protein